MPDRDNRRVRAEPISFDRLVRAVSDDVATRAAGLGHAVRVLLDGPPAARGAELAEDVLATLRAVGVDAVRVPLAGFVRPASVRLELGRTDPVGFYERWFDLPALRREVLEPLGPGGSGRYLPALWDEETDRSPRLAHSVLRLPAAVVVDGPLLLGAGLPYDVAVHLAMSPHSLARRTREDQRWTLAAYRRYEDEVGPASVADLVVRVDDPHHPALLTDQ